jgi:hypothetical protein
MQEKVESLDESPEWSGQSGGKLRQLMDR